VLAPLQRVPDAVEEQRAVGEPGERVVEGAPAELEVAVAQRVGHGVVIARDAQRDHERRDERGHAPPRLTRGDHGQRPGELRREHQRETRTHAHVST